MKWKVRLYTESSCHLLLLAQIRTQNCKHIRFRAQGLGSGCLGVWVQGLGSGRLEVWGLVFRFS